MSGDSGFYYCPYIPVTKMGYTPYGNLLAHISPRDANSLNWRPWFAWRPVQLRDGGTAWFQTVYRRKTTIEISRFALESPGEFEPRAKLSDYEYIDNVSYLMEAIKGETSLFNRAQELFRSHREGKFKL